MHACFMDDDDAAADAVAAAAFGLSTAFNYKCIGGNEQSPRKVFDSCIGLLLLLLALTLTLALPWILFRTLFFKRAKPTFI